MRGQNDMTEWLQKLIDRQSGKFPDYLGLEWTLAEPGHMRGRLVIKPHHIAPTGVGPLISTATVADIGAGEAFDRGRDFGAWLGLVPRQYSTGGKSILGRISKRGSRYLRTLYGDRQFLRTNLAAPGAQRSPAPTQYQHNFSLIR